MPRTRITQVVFVCTWHSSRLNDSGVVGVFATKELAVRGATHADSQGDTPEDLQWNEDQSEGFRPSDDHNFNIVSQQLVED